MMLDCGLKVAFFVNLASAPSFLTSFLCDWPMALNAAAEPARAQINGAVGSCFVLQVFDVERRKKGMCFFVFFCVFFCVFLCFFVFRIFR